MNTRTRLVSLAALLVLVACTAGGGGRQGGEPGTASSTGGPPAVAIPHVTPGGAPTLRAAIAKLCVPPGQTSGTATGSGSLPPDVVAIAHQVERARGHTFTHLPPATAVSDQEMNRRLLKSFSSTYPRSVYDRRTVAWRTIGVIGPGDDLYRAYRSFATGQVVGYYDPETGELVYRSSGDLGFSERFTLAHELTHALDDQTFDLTRLDPLNAHCLDERAEGALGLVEGSAQYYAAVAVAEDPSIDLSDLLQALAQSASGDSPPPGVPRFVFNQELWPYTAGEAFVASLAAGGTAAVDHAFEHLPVSTEQIIDPSRYPSDRPQQVSIPDVAGDLGSRWGDLDAMTIGEQWLQDMLGLRDGVSPDAATGWGGGGYRAWTDGRNVVVVLRTSWDQPDQAATFASALQDWVAGRSPAPAVVHAGSEVTAVFATTAQLVSSAQQALGNAG